MNRVAVSTGLCFRIQMHTISGNNFSLIQWLANVRTRVLRCARVFAIQHDGSGARKRIHHAVFENAHAAARAPRGYLVSRRAATRAPPHEHFYPIMVDATCACARRIHDIHSRFNAKRDTKKYIWSIVSNPAEINHRCVSLNNSQHDCSYN